MLSLKLVRSLVLGETINSPPLLNQTQNHTPHDDLHAHKHTQSPKSRTKTPLLLFVPTKELIFDTYRLATIARDIGMDLHPTPSLSHIIFSWSSSSPSPASLPSLWSSSSSSWPLSGDAIPLPFPSLSHASVSHLRCFVRLSKGLFILVFCKSVDKNSSGERISNWDCGSVSLRSRLTGDRIDSMDSLCRVLSGMGWTLFKTKNNHSLVSGGFGINSSNSVYLFRKVDSNRVRIRQTNGDVPTAGEFRIRELRLPHLDFRNAPLRILQYILLMTDNVFYLA